MDDLTFADELRQETINVPRANLHLAREIAYPLLDIGRYLERLEQLARKASERVQPDAPPSAQAQMLADFLFTEEGFGGNRADYGDPRNSYLNDLLDRRLGIPISLSLLFVAVARRLGLEAYGVGLPGHFIVGVREWKEQGGDQWGEGLLYDPFHGGRQVTVQECRQLVRETAGYDGPFDPRWLFPAAPRDILARMLNNLRLSYLQLGEWPAVTSTLELLRQVQPQMPGHLRDLGLVRYQQGHLYLAAQYLEAYLQQAPDTPEAAAIRENLTPDFSRWSRLN